MKKKRKIQVIFFSVAALALIFNSAVYAALEISTDNRAVDFGQIKPSESKELAYLGGYHHEITCNSSNARTWYLKVSLISPLSQGSNTIPLENFKWQLNWTDGEGTVTNPYNFREFSLTPELTYMSGAADNQGEDVRLRFKYYLEIPPAQAMGIYTTVIRFTLTEIL